MTAGRILRLPKPLSIGVHALVIPWMIFTVVVYGMILVGGFVKTWGLDNSLTLDHYARAFSIEMRGGAIAWTGVAWNSFWTTMEIALDLRAADSHRRPADRLPHRAAEIRRVGTCSNSR